MSIQCRLCGSRNIKQLYTSQRYSFKVGRCAQCGLVSVLEAPSEGTLREMYSQEQAAQCFADDVDNSKVHARHERVLAEIRTMLNHDDLSYSPRLFDVGAGSGGFLNAARAAGFEVYGNELSRAMVKMTWDKYEIALSENTLEQDERAAFFDVMTMWGLIVHVREPRLLLEHASRLLRRGGILYIYTPIWCLYDRIGLALARATYWTRLLDRRITLAHRRITLAHLQIFPRATLEWACKRADFEVERVEVVCEYNLRVTAYLGSLGVPERVRPLFAWSLDQLIDRNLFFVITCEFSVESVK